MKTLKALTILLSLNLMACAFDGQQVRDEQEKQKARDMAEKREPYDTLAGSYAGKLIIEDKSYDLFVNFTVEIDKDGNPVMVAQVKRTDITSPDAILKGTYAGGELRGSSQTSNIDKRVFNSINGRSTGSRITGYLTDSMGVSVGTFDVERASNIPRDLSTLGFCHPLLKNLREVAYEVSGNYTAVVNPGFREAPPYEIGLRINPSRTWYGTLQADFRWVNTRERQILTVYYTPWLNTDGTSPFGHIEMMSSPNEKLNVQINVRRTSPDKMVGEVKIGTAYANNVTFIKTAEPPTDICQ